MKEETLNLLQSSSNRPNYIRHALHRPKRQLGGIESAKKDLMLEKYRAPKRKWRRHNNLEDGADAKQVGVEKQGEWRLTRKRLIKRTRHPRRGRWVVVRWCARRDENKKDTNIERNRSGVPRNFRGSCGQERGWVLKNAETRAYFTPEVGEISGSSALECARSCTAVSL
jgi:hypothetical protein